MTGSRLTYAVNRCNVPPAHFASLEYQRRPIPVELDGVQQLYGDLFRRLQEQSAENERARCFDDYMTVRFRLPCEDLSPWPEAEPVSRPLANYRRLLLGWSFDSDSDAGAAWRQWVESRFGLRTRYHAEPIDEPDSPAYFRYMQACARATYNTNDLATQLDLLYSYCQFELRLRHRGQSHLLLFRGGREEAQHHNGLRIMAFNNLSSFTTEADEAYRFGPRVHAVSVPLAKIVSFDGLLPKALGGERECMVLGGLYRVENVR